MKGGYFTVKLDNYMSVISLDTLYFDSENEQDDMQQQAEQLKWLSNLLKNPPSKGHKWILASHIYETLEFNAVTDSENYGFGANFYENKVQA
jgi:3',5'-cyclic AMP phosphodiesterase CpdA